MSAILRRSHRASKLHQHREGSSNTSNWIENAGTTDALQLLDMFYLENRIGAWGGVFPYAEYYGPGFTIFPMCHREIIAEMASLPEQTRLNETFNRGCDRP